MIMQLAAPRPVPPAPPPSGEATLSLPEAWDEDTRERMIVERAMRPRSWERDGED